MNTRTSLIAIGATLALIAPAAASARAIVNQQGDTYFASKHVSTHKISYALSFASENGNRAGKWHLDKPGVIYTAPFGPNPIKTPGYSYSPGPINPSAYVDPNECAETGSNCTDEQLCTYWGENCDAITAVPQDASPVGDTTH